MPNPIHTPSQGNIENPLDKSVEEREEFDSEKVYDEKDKDYLNKFLQSRLESAKRMRSQPRAEYKELTYGQYFNSNEVIANTVLPPKLNEGDVIVSAGTVESKLDSLLSHIANLNLTPEIFAYDQNNNRIQVLGEALEDIIHDTELRDRGDGGADEEKQMTRQRELLKQGVVFVQEEWLKKWEMKKKLNKKYNGEFKEFNREEDITESLELVFEGPSRKVLYGPNVFLGDISEFYMDDQPFIFTVIRMNFDVAKTIYGKFENWKFVKRGMGELKSGATERTIYDGNWRLTELNKDQVEIVLYQDKPADEFQIVINSVMMLPIGFPLSAVTAGGQYNIAKQVFRVLNHKFAYGGSFVGSGSVKEISAIIDEMLKLFVLKTRKSFMPPYINTSGRVITSKALLPGRISMGIDAGSLVPVTGDQVLGVTQGEMAVLKEMQGLIDKNTVSQQFTGQQGKSGTTATEVVELQRQARLTLGLAVAACTFLETKIAYLRLYNIIANWFEPIDTRVAKIGEIRKIIKKFRRTTRETSISGRGVGERSVIPMDLQEGEELPDAETIRGLELEEEGEKGMPVKKIFMDPKAFKVAKILWYIITNPREREGSALNKLEFRELLGDTVNMMQFGSRPNVEMLEQEFARVHGKTKVFQKRNETQELEEQVSAAAGAGSPGAQGRANQPGVPKLQPGALGS